MINIKSLTEDDVGKWVKYTDFSKTEIGKIKSWNDKFIFVVYSCNHDWNNFKNYTAAATSPEDLVFSEGDECERKFGVKIITGASLDLICKECGLRLGLHSGTKCPTKSEILYEGRDYEGGNE